jgi:hypothetical protein
MNRTGLRLLLTFLLFTAGCSTAATSSDSPSAPSPKPTEQTRGPLAFPGAAGFGASASGGRGGKVIYVTNLKADGQGSFKAAAQTPGARVIVFEVAGNIPINGHLSVPYGDLTIACQSAPGGGVSFVGGTVVFGQLDDTTPFESEQNIKARNIIMRHCRSRDSAASMQRGDNADGFQFHNVDLLMLDHVSIAWAADESGATRRSKRITWQNCLITEPLINGKHSKGAHPYGPMASYGTHDWSMIGCFLSNGWHRFPHMMGNNRDVSGRSPYGGTEGRGRGRGGRSGGRSRDQSRGQFVNNRTTLGPKHPVFLFAGNTVYNVGGPEGIGGSEVAIGAQAVIENNAYYRGPETPPGWVPIRGHDRPDSAQSGSKILLRGNTLDGALPARQRDLLSSRHSTVPLPSESSTRWTAPDVSTRPALDLSSVGALPHDEIDARVLQEFESRTGKQGAPWRKAGDPVPSPATGKAAPDRDRDGMPDAWETDRGRDPASHDPWVDRDCNGWSDLEDYLNERAGDPRVVGDCDGGGPPTIQAQAPVEAVPTDDAPPPTPLPPPGSSMKASGSLTCADVVSFEARCVQGRGGSGLQARATLSGAHDGKSVTISVDGQPQTVTVRGSRAVLQQRGATSGSHTVSLTDPAGCAADVPVSCGGR